ncbi:MAG: hypothetical protein L0H55_13285 [Candidatus Nitrosocosmicus sp.]|nr:hypothetical protein [Candidatus Nitrosocosmicus sp.]
MVTVDELLFESATSLTFAVNCLEFCSNALAVFTPALNMCLEISFACCRAGFHASRVENITSFDSLMAETVLFETLLTNVVYTLTAASGVQKLVTNPLNASLYGLHVDWRELTTSF